MPFFEKFDWDPLKNDKALAQGRKSFAEMSEVFLQDDIRDAAIIESYEDENTGERRFVLLIDQHPADGKPYQIVFSSATMSHGSYRHLGKT